MPVHERSAPQAVMAKEDGQRRKDEEGRTTGLRVSRYFDRSTFTEHWRFGDRPKNECRSVRGPQIPAYYGRRSQCCSLRRFRPHLHWGAATVASRMQSSPTVHTLAEPWSLPSPDHGEAALNARGPRREPYRRQRKTVVKRECLIG